MNPKKFKDFSSTTRKYSKTFSPANLSWPRIINNPKIFKDFFVCKFVLTANHQLYPGNIQRLFGQQQSTAATSSSNQQQQPAAAINSSNQHQQSTAAISNNNQLSSHQQHPHNPRRLPLVTNTVPSRGYVLLEVDLGLAACKRVQPSHCVPFLLLSNFFKNPFLRFFPFC